MGYRVPFPLSNNKLDHPPLSIWGGAQEVAPVQSALSQERLAAVEELSAGMAHHFNNALQAMIGYAELARLRPDLPASVERDLTCLIKRGQEAAQLIRQLLDFSCQLVAQQAEIELGPVLEETVNRLERTLPEEICLSLTIEPGPEAYILKANSAQIQQALTNLADNAREAMASGGRLQFRLAPAEVRSGERPPHPGMQSGNWLVLTVSDTGSGIPAQVLPYIFEPFYTTKALGQGTGLGLAQVYGIIKQHGGKIEVDSRVGEGTTFSLYLPIIISDKTNHQKGGL